MYMWKMCSRFRKTNCNEPEDRNKTHKIKQEVKMQRENWFHNETEIKQTTLQNMEIQVPTLKQRHKVDNKTHWPWE